MAHLWKKDTQTQSSSQQEVHVLAQTLNGTRHVKCVLAPVGGMQLIRFGRIRWRRGHQLHPPYRGKDALHMSGVIQRVMPMRDE